MRKGPAALAAALGVLLGASGAAAPAGGDGVDYDEFCVTKPLDKASPQLFLSALNGTPHASAKLEVLAADGVSRSARCTTSPP